MNTATETHKGKRDDKSESRGRSMNGSGKSAALEDASKEESESKSSSFVEQLDMALEGASESIGDIVKKIEALTPKDGAISRVSKYAVSKMEVVQDYLDENGSKEMFSSVWQFVKRSPLPIGLGIVGVAIGAYLQSDGSSQKEEKHSSKKSAKAA